MFNLLLSTLVTLNQKTQDQLRATTWADFSSLPVEEIKNLKMDARIRMAELFSLEYIGELNKAKNAYINDLERAEKWDQSFYPASIKFNKNQTYGQDYEKRRDALFEDGNAELQSIRSTYEGEIKGIEAEITAKENWLKAGKPGPKAEDNPVTKVKKAKVKGKKKGQKKSDEEQKLRQEAAKTELARALREFQSAARKFISKLNDAHFQSIYDATEANYIKCRVNYIKSLGGRNDSYGKSLDKLYRNSRLTALNPPAQARLKKQEDLKQEEERRARADLMANLREYNRQKGINSDGSEIQEVERRRVTVTPRKDLKGPRGALKTKKGSIDNFLQKFNEGDGIEAHIRKQYEERRPSNWGRLQSANIKIKNVDKNLRDKQIARLVNVIDKLQIDPYLDSTQKAVVLDMQLREIENEIESRNRENRFSFKSRLANYCEEIRTVLKKTLIQETQKTIPSYSPDGVTELLKQYRESPPSAKLDLREKVNELVEKGETNVTKDKSLKKKKKGK